MSGLEMRGMGCKKRYEGCRIEGAKGGRKIIMTIDVSGCCCLYAVVVVEIEVACEYKRVNGENVQPPIAVELV